MNHETQKQLLRYRQELKSLKIEDWARISNWCDKVLPFFRTALREHLADYQAILEKQPQYQELPMLLTHDKARDDAESQRIKRIEQNTFRQECKNFKERILAYLDGLIEASKYDEQPSQSGIIVSVAREKQMSDENADRNAVFVVHGRNDKARSAIFAFLRSLELRPLEWSQMVKETGQASPYVGEVLEAGFRKARAVVVLLTPDEEVRLVPEFRAKPADDEVSYQPRPNVILEAGMSLGKDASRTVLVELGEMREISDILGRHVIRMNDTPAMRAELAQRLETAGCAVNRTGKDWYQEGDFAGCITKAPPVQPALSHKPEPCRTLSDVDTLSVLESWLQSRQSLANEQVLYFAEIDKALNISPGSAKALLADAATGLGYRVKRHGDETILLVADLY